MESLYSACLPIIEFSSIEEGYAACNENVSGTPFIVKQCASFFSEESSELAGLEVCLRSQMRKEHDIKGYSMGRALRLSGSIILKEFDNQTLKFNVVDSVSTRGYSLLPQYIQDLNLKSRIDDAVWLAYVLSPSNPNAIGELHIDPPYGSNWQYLVKGRKIWFTLDNREFDIVEYNQKRKEESENGDFTFTIDDILRLSTEYKVYYGVISSGDYISCPINWPHAVITLDDTIGMSGYTATPEMLQQSSTL